MEIWKDIEGYEGHYQVSSKGRIKSIKKQVGRKESELIMKPFKTWWGYQRINLTKNGKLKMYAVHRLVAQAFIENTDNKPFVDHINGDRTDNRVENLRWCTPKENSENSILLRNTGSYKAVLVKDNFGNTFKSYREAARHWNLSPNTVKNDVLGKTHYTEQQKGSNYEREVRFERG